MKLVRDTWLIFLYEVGILVRNPVNIALTLVQPITYLALFTPFIKSVMNVSSYGDAYQEAGYRRWGDRVVQDIVDATRFAIRKGFADPKRICIYGGSFGGFHGGGFGGFHGGGGGFHGGGFAGGFHGGGSMHR